MRTEGLEKRGRERERVRREDGAGVEEGSTCIFSLHVVVCCFFCSGCCLSHTYSHIQDSAFQAKEKKMLFCLSRNLRPLSSSSSSAFWFSFCLPFDVLSLSPLASLFAAPRCPSFSAAASAPADDAFPELRSLWIHVWIAGELLPPLFQASAYTAGAHASCIQDADSSLSLSLSLSLSPSLFSPQMCTYVLL